MTVVTSDGIPVIPVTCEPYPPAINWTEIHNEFGYENEKPLLTDPDGIVSAIGPNHNELLRAVVYIRLNSAPASSTTRVALMTHWVRFRRDNVRSIIDLLCDFGKDPNEWLERLSKASNGRIGWEDGVVGLWISLTISRRARKYRNVDPHNDSDSDGNDRVVDYKLFERAEYKLLWCVHQIYRRGVFRHAPGQWDPSTRKIGSFTLPMRDGAKFLYQKPRGIGPWCERSDPPFLTLCRGHFLFIQLTQLPEFVKRDGVTVEATHQEQDDHRQRQLNDNPIVKEISAGLFGVLGVPDTSLVRWYKGTLTPPPPESPKQHKITILQHFSMAELNGNRVTIEGDDESNNIARPEEEEDGLPPLMDGTTLPFTIGSSPSSSSNRKSSSSDDDDGDELLTSNMIRTCTSPRWIVYNSADEAFVPVEHDAFGDPIFFPGDRGYISPTLVEAAELDAQTHAAWTYNASLALPGQSAHAPSSIRHLSVALSDRNKILAEYRARYMRWEAKRLDAEELRLRFALIEDEDEEESESEPDGDGDGNESVDEWTRMVVDQPYLEVGF